MYEQYLRFLNPDDEDLFPRGAAFRSPQMRPSYPTAAGIGRAQARYTNMATQHGSPAAGLMTKQGLDLLSGKASAAPAAKAQPLFAPDTEDAQKWLTPPATDEERTAQGEKWTKLIDDVYAGKPGVELEMPRFDPRWGRMTPEYQKAQGDYNAAYERLTETPSIANRFKRLVSGQNEQWATRTLLLSQARMRESDADYERRWMSGLKPVDEVAYHTGPSGLWQTTKSGKTALLDPKGPDLSHTFMDKDLRKMVMTPSGHAQTITEMRKVDQNDPDARSVFLSGASTQGPLLSGAFETPVYGQEKVKGGVLRGSAEGVKFTPTPEDEADQALKDARLSLIQAQTTAAQALAGQRSTNTPEAKADTRREENARAAGIKAAQDAQRRAAAEGKALGATDKQAIYKEAYDLVMADPGEAPSVPEGGKQVRPGLKLLRVK